MKPVWQQRNFMLIWGGQMVSWIGTEISMIALPLIVLSLTGSPALAGSMAAMRGFIYMLLAIPAGALIDRWDRKIVMLIANAGSGIAMGSIALALFLHRLTIPQLYITGAIEGGFFVFANLARFTSIPLLVSKEQFPSAVAYMNVADFLARSIGPALGGALFQIAGAITSFLTDSLSYFINAVSVFFIDAPLKIPQQTTTKLHHEIREGLQWFWKQKAIRFLTFMNSGVVIVAIGLYLLIIVMAKNYHASALAIGIVLGIASGGGILGSFAAPYFHKRFTFRQLVIACIVGSTIIFGCYFFASTTLLLGIITACMNFIEPIFNVTTSSFTTPKIPDEIRGRVSSIMRLTDLGAMSLGFFLMGFAIQYLGITKTIAVFFGFLILLSILVITNRSIKTS